jgi:hypothetical protein
VAAYPVGEIETQIDAQDIGLERFTQEMCKALSRQCDIYLSDSEKDSTYGYISTDCVWDMVVNDQPAVAFTDVHIPQLEAYCRHVVQSRVLADALLNFNPDWLNDDDGLKRYDKLLGMHERETRAMGAVARALRITRQSIDQQTIARMNVNDSRKGRKPWELASEPIGTD